MADRGSTVLTSVARSAAAAACSFAIIAATAGETEDARGRTYLLSPFLTASAAPFETRRTTETAEIRCVWLRLERTDSRSPVPLLEAPIDYRRIERVSHLRDRDAGNTILEHETLQARLDPGDVGSDGVREVIRRIERHAQWETFRVGRRRHPVPLPVSDPAAVTIWRWDGERYRSAAGPDPLAVRCLG